MATIRVYLLRADQDSAFCSAMLERFNKQEGIKAEVYDLGKVSDLKDAGKAWYVVFLAPELRSRSQQLDWLLTHHAGRVVPVLVRNCEPRVLHDRLEYLTRHDALAQDAKALAQKFPRVCWEQGTCRAKAATSLVMVLSLKGGVAKTTTAVTVAEFLAEQGNRVLVIDTDHQCGASAMLLGEDRLEALEDKRKTLNDLFVRALDGDFTEDRIDQFVATAASIRSTQDRLHVIPGSLRLEDFVSNFRASQSKVAKNASEAFDFLKKERKDLFARWMKANYDYVIIDCPPSIAWQVRFFLLAAEAYVTPSIPDRLSVRGARYLWRRIANIGPRFSPSGWSGR